MQAQPVSVVPAQVAEGIADTTAGGQAHGSGVNAPSGAFSTVLASQIKEQSVALLGRNGKPLTKAALIDLLRAQRKLTRDQPASDSLAALIVQLAAALQPAQLQPAQLQPARGQQKNNGRDGLPLILLANSTDSHLTRSERLLEAAVFAAKGKSLPLAADVGKKYLEGVRDRTKEVAALPAVQLPAGVISHTTQVTVPAAANLSVAPQIGSTHWDAALGQKIVWMASQRQHAADLQLNPPNLGPLSVRLTFGHDQLSAVFASHHAMVRETIEAALPRLREMLAESGIAMGNVTVGADSSFGQQQSTFSGQREHYAGGRDIAPFTSLRATSFISRGTTLLRDDGMVDTFV